MKAQELEQAFSSWRETLVRAEKSKNTISQYSNAVGRFMDFVRERQITEIDKDTMIAYKEAMKNELKENEKKARPKTGRSQWGIRSNSTINARIIALNKFMRESGYPELTLKTIRDESSNVRDDVLTEKEYQRLLKWADKLGMKRAGLIMEVLAGTGIRIAELESLTVKSLKKRVFEVDNKGKKRTVPIPRQLAKKLKAYCKEQGIESGVIFRGRPRKEEGTGEMVIPPLNQTTIRREMKLIGGKARGISKDKIHPHSLRHLFAKRWADMPGSNPFLLPQILGHSVKHVIFDYTTLTTKELIRAVDQVEEYYNSKRGQL